MPVYNPDQPVAALRVQNIATSERIDIVCNDDSAGAIAGKYFKFNSPSTGYYAWYEVDGVGADPAVGGRTGVKVTVTEKEKSTVTTVADVSGSLGGKYFLISSPSVNYYVWFDVANGSVDPAVVGRTGLEVNISADDSAATVATAAKLVIDAHAAFVATVLSNVVTVTNASQGVATDVGAGNSGFAVAVVRQGGAGTGAALASLSATAIDAVSGVAATSSSAVLSISADATGDALNAADQDTGFSVSVVVQGQPDGYGPGTSVGSLTNSPTNIAALI